MAQKYRKKPLEVEALQWDGLNQREMYEFLGGDPNDYMKPIGDNFFIDHFRVERGLIIRTSEGDMAANVGDYIIKEPFDKERKYYPCKKEVFEATYELIEEISMKESFKQPELVYESEEEINPKDLIVMNECLRMLKLTSKTPELHEATKKFVKEKLNNNDLFNKVVAKMTKEN